jgi:hypothetical protein
MFQIPLLAQVVNAFILFFCEEFIHFLLRKHFITEKFQKKKSGDLKPIMFFFSM